MAIEESPQHEENDEELEPPSSKRLKLSENEAEFESASSFSEQAEVEVKPKIFESATAGIVNEIVRRAALEASRYNITQQAQRQEMKHRFSLDALK
jgi:hypothetical protein